MPRLSPFPISLSTAEEAELRRRAGKYTLPYFQVQRAKMILYAAEGMPNDEIAACLDTRREVVSLWRKPLGGIRIQLHTYCQWQSLWHSLLTARLLQ